jgi:hypothetical protein
MQTLSQMQGRRQKQSNDSLEANRATKAMAPVDEAFVANLFADLDAGGDSRARAVESLREPGVVRSLSFDSSGCRSVQLAFDLVDRRTATELAGDLKGSVAEAIKSPFANYVIQKVIKVLSPGEVPFVVEELALASLDLACHKFGCRIYSRLLEHAASDGRTAQLLDEVLMETEELATHTYGHHVVESVLEHGLPHQKRRIVQTLRQNMARNLRSRNAIYVIEKALSYGSQEDAQALAFDILAQPSEVVAALAANQYGSSVARALLRQQGQVAECLLDHLRKPSSQQTLEATKAGRRLCAEFFLAPANIVQGR